MTTFSQTILAVFNLGPMEITIILILALLVFGKRLPEVGRSLGRGIIEFKKGVKGIEEEIDDEVQKAEAKEVEAKTVDTEESEPETQKSGE